MKKYLIFLMLFSNLTFAGFNDLFLPNKPPSQPPVNMGPFAVGYTFCKKIQSLTPILMAYSNIQWPSVGVGFSFGMVSNESVIMKICDFIIQLESLNTEGAIFAGARLLNEMTDKKWDHHLAQADMTWNMMNSMYDFRGDGGYRKGALMSASTHRRMINFTDKTMKWYGKSTDNPNGGLTFKNERKRELQALTRQSYQRAILEEATSCPKPTSNRDLSKEYEQKIVPRSNLKRNLERDIQSLRRALNKMGEDFLSDTSELQAYLDSIINMINDGYKFRVKIDKTTVSKKENTGRKDAEGKPVFEPVNKTRPFQNIKAIYNSDPWKVFKDAYIPMWKSYMNGQFWTKGVRGLLTDKKGILEQRYRSYSFECSDRKLSKGISSDKTERGPDFRIKLTEARKKCKEGLRSRSVSKSQALSVMERYFKELKTSVRLYKQASAEIWTYESKMLGVMPLDTAKGSEYALKAAQADKEDCRPDYTPIEMENLKAAKKDVEIQITENIAKNNSKRLMMEEAKAQASKDSSEEQDNMLKKHRQKLESLKTSQDVTMPTTTPTGLIFVPQE